MATTGDFRVGLIIEIEKELFSILEYQHFKPGKGGAYLKTKLKNIRIGQTVEKTFRSGEKINKVFLESKKCEFLYQKDKLFYFMDNTSYEELILTENEIRGVSAYLSENMTVDVLMYQGKVIGIELPIFVELEVTDAEPGVRGDTISGANKHAFLSTGARIQVPLFVNKGDRVKLDTRSGEYIERV